MPLNAIKLLLLDVDGVMTDGSIIMDDRGFETKRFNVRDGLGIKAWQRCGLMCGILTGRASRVVTHRARELGVELLAQGSHNKVQTYEDLCRRAGVEDEQVAYMGDDLADLGVMRRVAYPITVPDAVEEIRAVARYVTATAAGRGAVREAIEHLLKQMGRWDEVVEHYA